MNERINDFLNRPYPLYFRTLAGWIYFTCLMLILAVGLNIYQPLGLTNWNEYHKPLVLSIYCLVYAGTYACLHILYSFTHRKNYKPNRWTVGRELQIVLIYLPVMALTTTLYVWKCIQEFEHSPASVLRLQFYNYFTAAGIISGFGFFISKTLPAYSKRIPVIPVSKGAYNFIIQIKNMELYARNILFAEISHNTLRVYHEKEGNVLCLEVSMTLSEFKKRATGYPPLKKCHSSYIVNVNYIASWEGTLEKMTLHLNYPKFTVPVSETYSAAFKEMMEQNSILKIK